MVETQEPLAARLDSSPGPESQRITSHWLRQVVFALIIGLVVLGIQLLVEERGEDRADDREARRDESELVRDNLQFVRSVVMAESTSEVQPTEENVDIDGDGFVDLAFDLRQRPFAGIQLPNQNLSGLNLAGAYFADSNLSGANLTMVDLSGAVLSNADLSGADLSYAILFDADLSGADLSGADLLGATFISADLSETDMSNADLEGADLEAAVVSLVDLSTANLSSAQIVGVIWDPDSPPRWPAGFSPPENAWISGDE